MQEKVIRVRDMRRRVGDIDAELKVEKNKKEVARLTDEQAALKFVLRTQPMFVADHASLGPK